MNKITKLLFATLLASAPSLFTVIIEMKTEERALNEISIAKMPDDPVKNFVDLTDKWDLIVQAITATIAEVENIETQSLNIDCTAKKADISRALEDMKALQNLQCLLAELDQAFDKDIAEILDAKFEKRAKFKKRDLTLLVKSYLLPLQEDVDKFSKKMNADIAKLKVRAGTLGIVDDGMDQS